MSTEKKKKLREGITTGTCAAAAAAAAVETFFGTAPETVTIDLPDLSRTIDIHIHKTEAPQIQYGMNTTAATVIKDAGDDPDITHGARIGAQVSVIENDVNRIVIKGGPGVGKVTRPGLPVQIGESAINPVPRKMIEHEIRRRLPKDRAFSVEVDIFVENGEMLARKTLNPKLGIVGGVSILGTSGIVKPFSAKSYEETIDICLKSARCDEQTTCVLSTGRKSERLAQQKYADLHERCFVQTADFFSYALQKTAVLGFDHIILSCFFGKLCKWAMNMQYTHAKSGLIDFNFLSQIAHEAGSSSEFCRFIESAKTAREIFETNYNEKPVFVDTVGKRALSNAWAVIKQKSQITVCLWDYEERFFQKWNTNAV